MLQGYQTGRPVKKMTKEAQTLCVLFPHICSKLQLQYNCEACFPDGFTSATWYTVMRTLSYVHRVGQTIHAYIITVVLAENFEISIITVICGVCIHVVTCSECVYFTESWTAATERPTALPHCTVTYDANMHNIDMIN